MEPTFIITSRVSLRDGTLHEEILHTTIPKDPPPLWQRALRGLLCLWLFYYFGFFDGMKINFWLMCTIWFIVVAANFVILYAIFKDCRPSRQRK